MKHARQDYDRIQDPSGKIGADEPVFLLRAQDMSAPETIRFWADENVRNGGDLALSQLAEKWADNMEAWQRDNRSKPADLGQAASPAPDSAQEGQGGLTELVDALCKESGYTMSAERVRAILARQSAPRPAHETIVQDGDELVCTACGTTAPTVGSVPEADDGAAFDAAIESGALVWDYKTSARAIAFAGFKAGRRAAAPQEQAASRAAVPEGLAHVARQVIEHFEAERGKRDAPGHCHDVEGVWDSSNMPEIAGKPCDWCAVWKRFKELAAAPATQDQAERAAVPEGFVLMPKVLTAENGAKAALIGEFKESIQVRCPECDGSDEDYGGCATCEGAGSVSHVIPVGWSNIKAIYSRAVELLAAPVAAQPTPPSHKPCTMRMSQGDEVVTVTGASGQQGSTRTVEPDECAANMNGHSYGQHGPNGERQCKWCGEEDSAQVDTPLWDEGGEPANEAAITVERAETLARKLYAEALATDSTIKPVMFGNLTEAERAEWLRKAKFVYPSAQVDAEGGDHG